MSKKQKRYFRGFITGSSIALLSLILILQHGYAVSFNSPGYLAGGSFSSTAHGVSADGSVVVSYSSSGSGGEAFRWTSGGGMAGLGDLAGGIFSSEAQAVSADDTVVVGRSHSATGYQAFIWDDTMA